MVRVSVGMYNKVHFAVFSDNDKSLAFRFFPSALPALKRQTDKQQTGPIRVPLLLFEARNSLMLNVE